MDIYFRKNMRADWNTNEMDTLCRGTRNVLCADVKRKNKHQHQHTQRQTNQQT